MVEVMAQEEVRSMLRDPDSAKFADINSFVVGQGAIIACGKVNAKNGFGGYGGFKRFVSNGGGITAIEGQVDDFATMWKLCR